MKYYLLLFVLFLGIACSKSDETPNTQPEDSEQTNEDDDPQQEEEQTEDPFTPKNLTLIADTGSGGDIIVMQIAANSSTVSTINLTNDFGFNNQALTDFRESKKITWTDIYSNPADVGQFDLLTGATTTLSDPCDIEMEGYPYVTSKGNELVIATTYNDPITGEATARIRMTNEGTICDITEIPGYTTQKVLPVGNYIFARVKEYLNQNKQKILRINVNSGNIEGEIPLDGNASYTSDGSNLYVFSSDGFAKYDIMPLELLSTNDISYILTEHTGAFETSFHEDKMYVNTGFPQPGPSYSGYTILNRNTGEVIEAANSNFIVKMQLNMHNEYPGVVNFFPECIALDLSTESILLSINDPVVNRSFLVYTNKDGELLEVIETPYPAWKIIIRD